MQKIGQTTSSKHLGVAQALFRAAARSTDERHATVEGDANVEKFE